MRSLETQYSRLNIWYLCIQLQLQTYQSLSAPTLGAVRRKKIDQSINNVLWINYRTTILLINIYQILYIIHILSNCAGKIVISCKKAIRAFRTAAASGLVQMYPKRNFSLRIRLPSTRIRSKQSSKTHPFKEVLHSGTFFKTLFTHITLF